MSHSRFRKRHEAHRDPPPPRVEASPCPVCKRPVRDLASAIAHQESGGPAHFDCILKHLRETTDALPHEKICYLGKGSFGIIQYRNSHKGTRFFIRKRIQYENPEVSQEWRRRMPPPPIPNL